MLFTIKMPRNARMTRVLNLAAKLEGNGLTYQGHGNGWTTTDPDVAAQMRRAGAVVAERS